MAEEIRIPASGGGLIRYGDEYETKFKLKPAHVVAIIIATIAFELFLRLL
ncbi:MAG: preprotein translocase subunit Sec61beta [Candidatus Pacearchaeota archaeon]|nr:preprotein translocase subunit Sec61beta [Candidatus Pacearchaeota archaeon]